MTTEYTPPDLTLFGDEHVERYQATDGVVGGEWNGVPILLLTTIGRRSGLPRTSALIFGRHGDDYVVVASVGGAPRHPQWYLNLDATPEVQVQVMADRFGAGARTADPREKPQLWALMRTIWPNYDEYQRRTTRDIPIVVLTPARDD